MMMVTFNDQAMNLGMKEIKIKVGIFSNKVTAVEMKNNFSFLFLCLDFIKILTTTK